MLSSSRNPSASPVIDNGDTPITGCLLCLPCNLFCLRYSVKSSMSSSVRSLLVLRYTPRSTSRFWRGLTASSGSFRTVGDIGAAQQMLKQAAILLCGGLTLAPAPQTTSPGKSPRRRSAGPRTTENRSPRCSTRKTRRLAPYLSGRYGVFRYPYARPVLENASACADFVATSCQEPLPAFP